MNNNNTNKKREGRQSKVDNVYAMIYVLHDDFVVLSTYLMLSKTYYIHQQANHGIFFVVYFYFKRCETHTNGGRGRERESK